MSEQIDVLKQVHNVGTQYFRIATEFSSFPAIISEATTITHGQLLAAAYAFAKRFQLEGVNRASTIALNTGDLTTSVTVLVATSLLGCRLVTAGEVVRKQGIIKPTHFFRTPDAKGRKGAGFVVIDETWFTNASSVDLSEIETFPGYADSDDIWQILHTSGTTGKPKFIGLTHRIVSDRTAAIAADFPTAQTTCAMLFNCTSRPFFARAIGALLNACTIVDSSDAAFWKQCGVNTVFCSPSQYNSFVKKYGIPPMLKKVEISGAKLDDETAQLLDRSFDEIFDIYGASETNKSFTNVVEVDPSGRVTRKGLPLDSVIEIIDDNGELRPSGTAGTVRVKNGYIVNGYMSAPEATQKNFVDGWFYPGDLAMFGSSGELNVLGRNDEVISFGGIKIDAQLIDVIIQTVPGVKDAICFKSPKTDRNEVLAFVSFDDNVDHATCLQQIRHDYEKHTHLPCFLGPIHQIDEIPYNENGRPMREFCQEIVLRKSGASGSA